MRTQVAIETDFPRPSAGQAELLPVPGQLPRRSGPVAIPPRLAGFHFAGRSAAVKAADTFGLSILSLPGKTVLLIEKFLEFFNLLGAFFLLLFLGLLLFVDLIDDVLDRKAGDLYIFRSIRIVRI